MPVDGVARQLADAGYPNAFLRDGSRSFTGGEFILAPSAGNDAMITMPPDPGSLNIQDSLSNLLMTWQVVGGVLSMSWYATFDSSLVPTTDDAIDLGTSAAEFRHGYFDGTLFVDTLSLDATAGLGVSTHMNPTLDDSKDLGSSTREWRTLYLDGAAYIDTLQVDVALNLDNIDVNATSVATVGGVIPITVEGTTRYIPFYESYV